jgi:hypothetical protein
MSEEHPVWEALRWGRRRTASYDCSGLRYESDLTDGEWSLSGELSAVVDLRRHFPGIVDNENARLCVRTIASWQLLPLPPKKPRTYRTKSSTR